MIRVLLVDDQPLLRSGFRALLDLEDDIEVVAEAADGEAALGGRLRAEPRGEGGFTVQAELPVDRTP
ncbi:hypothetical protein [Streptomyces sp. NBC_01604]|uniref:hypothetical protein n=1 Tax=Streptomyces sp. NBC_01604 TaxID=2975894 RepID=UPI00386F63E8